GLFDQHLAGGDVPRLQSLLPESVEAACGDVGQIDGRAAQPAGAARELGEAAESGDHLRQPVAIAVGKTGADDRFDEPGRMRDAQLLAVERGALAAGRVEDLVAQRIDRAAGEGTTVFLRRDSAAEERNAVRIVGGAVERIDDEARGAPRTALAALFGKDRDAGRALAQHL